LQAEAPEHVAINDDFHQTLGIRKSQTQLPSCRSFEVTADSVARHLDRSTLFVAHPGHVRMISPARGHVRFFR
jgi:hypothetical protein